MIADRILSIWSRNLSRPRDRTPRPEIGMKFGNLTSTVRTALEILLKPIFQLLQLIDSREAT